MTIKKIQLYKRSIVEKDGDFKLEISDVEEVPCVITNRALQVCKQYGVTETSLLEGLLIMGASMEGDMPTRATEDTKILQAIYVGYVGGQLLLGNAKPKYNYDEFLDVYHDTEMEKFQVYQALMLPDENGFEKSISKNIKKTVSKGEKK